MIKGENSELLIREANLFQDYISIVDIWKNAGSGIHLGRSDSEEEIKKKQARDPDLFLVAEIRGSIVGTVLGGFDGRRGMIYHMAVKSEYRNQGIGDQLVAELEDRLKKKGCIRSYLLIVPENDNALKFYTHRGWEKLELFVMGKDFLK